MARRPAKEILDELMWDFGECLVNEDADFGGVMAETNAYAYTLKQSEINHAEYENAKGINFSVVLRFSGEQDPEKPWCGDQITVDVNGVARLTDEIWRVEDYDFHSETNAGKDED
jgi:hypothetical protein